MDHVEMERRYEEMKRRLEDYKHEHLLKYWNDLSPQSQKDFMDQLESIDFEEIFRMRHKAQEDYVYAEKYLEEDDMVPVDVQVIKHENPLDMQISFNFLNRLTKSFLTTRSRNIGELDWKRYLEVQ